MNTEEQKKNPNALVLFLYATPYIEHFQMRFKCLNVKFVLTVACSNMQKDIMFYIVQP